MRIYGISEGTEKGNLTSFINGMLSDLFGHDICPPPYVNVAHRIGANKDKTRCLIAKLNSFDIRQKIVHLAAASAKGAGGLLYKGQKISIARDLTSEQRKQQSSFDELRSLLRKTDLRYGVAFPAKMLITFKDKTHSFTSSSEAMEFYITEIKPTLDAGFEASPDGVAAGRTSIPSA